MKFFPLLLLLVVVLSLTAPVASQPTLPTLTTCRVDPGTAPLLFGQKITLACTPSFPPDLPYIPSIDQFYFLPDIGGNCATDPAPTLTFRGATYDAARNRIKLDAVLATPAGFVTGTAYKVCYHAAGTGFYDVRMSPTVNALTPNVNTKVTSVLTTTPNPLRVGLTKVFLGLSRQVAFGDSVALIKCVGCSDVVATTLLCEVSSVTFQREGDTSDVAGYTHYASPGRYAVCYGVLDTNDILSWTVSAPNFINLETSNPSEYTVTANFQVTVLTFLGSDMTTGDTVRIIVGTATCDDQSLDRTLLSTTVTTLGVVQFNIAVRATAFARVCYRGATWFPNVWTSVYLRTTVVASTTTGDLRLEDFTPTVTTVMPSNVAIGEEATIVIKGIDLLTTDFAYALLANGNAACDINPFDCNPALAVANCTSFSVVSSDSISCKLRYFVIDATESKRLCICYQRSLEARPSRTRQTTNVTFALPNPHAISLSETPIRPGRLTYVVLIAETDPATIDSLWNGRAQVIDPSFQCSDTTPALTTVSIDQINGTHWVLSGKPRTCFRLCFMTNTLARWVRVPHVVTQRNAQWPAECGLGDMYVGIPATNTSTLYLPRRKQTAVFAFESSSARQNDTVRLVPYVPGTACLFSLCSKKTLCDTVTQSFVVTATQGLVAQAYVYISSTYDKFVVCYKSVQDSGFAPIPSQPLASGLSELDFVFSPDVAKPNSMTLTPSTVHDDEVQITLTVDGTSKDRAVWKICTTAATEWICPIEILAEDSTTTDATNITFSWDTIDYTAAQTLCLCFYAASGGRHIPSFVSSIPIVSAQPAAITGRFSTIPNTPLELVFVSRSPWRSRALYDRVSLYREVSTAYCLCRPSPECEAVYNPSPYSLVQEGDNTFLRFPLGLPLYTNSRYVMCYRWVSQTPSYSILTRLVLPPISVLPISWKMETLAVSRQLFDLVLFAPSSPTFANATCVLVAFVGTRCAALTTTSLAVLAQTQTVGRIETVLDRVGHFHIPMTVNDGAYGVCCLVTPTVIVEIPKFVNETFTDVIALNVTTSNYLDYAVTPAGPTEGQSFTISLACTPGRESSCYCADPKSVMIRKGANAYCWNVTNWEMFPPECLQTQYNFRNVLHTEVMQGEYTLCVKDIATQGITRMSRTLVIGARNPSRVDINFGIIVSGDQVNEAVFTIQGVDLNSATDKIKIMPFGTSCYDPPTDSSKWNVFRTTILPGFVGTGATVRWAIPSTHSLEATIVRASYCTSSTKKTYDFACALKLCYQKGTSGTFSLVPYSTGDTTFYLEAGNPSVLSISALYERTYPELYLTGSRLSALDTVALYTDRSCSVMVAEQVSNSVVSTNRLLASSMLYLPVSQGDSVVCYTWAPYGRLVPITFISDNKATHNFTRMDVSSGYVMAAGETLRQSLLYPSPPCASSKMALSSVHFVTTDRACRLPPAYTALPQYTTISFFLATSVVGNIVSTILPYDGTYTECATVCGIVHRFDAVFVGRALLNNLTLTPATPRAYMILNIELTYSANTDNVKLDTADKIYFILSAGFTTCQPQSSVGVVAGPVSTQGPRSVGVTMGVTVAGEYVWCYLRPGGTLTKGNATIPFLSRHPSAAFYSNGQLRYDSTVVMNFFAQPADVGFPLASGDLVALTAVTFLGSPLADCRSPVEYIPATYLVSNKTMSARQVVTSIANIFVCYKQVSTNNWIHVGRLDVTPPRIENCVAGGTVYARHRVVINCTSKEVLSLVLSSAASSQDLLTFSRTSSCSDRLVVGTEVEMIPASFRYLNAANSIMVRFMVSAPTFLYICTDQGGSGIHLVESSTVNVLAPKTGNQTAAPNQTVATATPTPTTVAPPALSWRPLSPVVVPIGRADPRFSCLRVGDTVVSLMTNQTVECRAAVSELDMKTFTDTVVSPVTEYLSRVLRAQLPLPSHDNHWLFVHEWTWQCGGVLLREIPQRFHHPIGSEIGHAGMVLFLTFQPMDQFAFSRVCQFEASTNRPVVGVLNLWPDNGRTMIQNQMMVLHEILHFLAMNAEYWASDPTYFIGADLRPLPRDSVVRMALRPEGHLAQFIVTPRVKAFVSDHFACDAGSVFGAELENNGAVGQQALNHWESRVFYEDVLSSTVGDKITNLTFAFLEDSGWYRVEYANAYVGRLVLGRNQGCAFLHGRCNDTVPAPWDTSYCLHDASIRRCTVDKRGVGDCSLQTYPGNPVPWPMRYSSGEDNDGGLEAMEYCPARSVYQFCRGGQTCVDFIGGPTPSQCLPMRCVAGGTAEFDVGGKTFQCPRAGGRVVGADVDATWVCADYSTLCPSTPTSIDAAVDKQRLTFDAFSVPSALDFNNGNGAITDFVFFLETSASHPFVNGSLITICFPPSLNASMVAVSRGTSFTAVTIVSRSASNITLRLSQVLAIFKLTFTVKSVIVSHPGDPGFYPLVRVTTNNYTLFTESSNPPSDEITSTMNPLAAACVPSSRASAGPANATLKLHFTDMYRASAPFVTGSVTAPGRVAFIRFPIAAYTVIDGRHGRTQWMSNNTIFVTNVSKNSFFAPLFMKDTTTIVRDGFVVGWEVGDGTVVCVSVQLPPTPYALIPRPLGFDVTPTPACPGCKASLLFSLLLSPNTSIQENDTVAILMPVVPFQYETRGFLHGPTPPNEWINATLVYGTTRHNCVVLRARVIMSVVMVQFPCNVTRPTANNGSYRVAFSIGGWTNPRQPGDTPGGMYSVHAWRGGHQGTFLHAEGLDALSDSILLDTCSTTQCNGHGRCMPKMRGSGGCECYDGFVGVTCTLCGDDLYPPGDCSVVCHGDVHNKALCSGHGMMGIDTATGHCVCKCDQSFCGSTCHSNECSGTPSPFPSDTAKPPRTVYLTILIQAPWTNASSFSKGITRLDARVLASQVQVLTVDLTPDAYAVRVVFSLVGIPEVLLKDVIPRMQATVAAMAGPGGFSRSIEEFTVISRSSLTTSAVMPSALATVTPRPTNTPEITNNPNETLPATVTTVTGNEGLASKTMITEFIIAIVVGVLVIFGCLLRWYCRTVPRRPDLVPPPLTPPTTTTTTNKAEEMTTVVY